MYRSKNVIKKTQTSFWFEGGSIAALVGVCISGTSASLWLVGTAVLLTIVAVITRCVLVRQHVSEEGFSRWAITQLIKKILRNGFVCFSVLSALLFGALIYHPAQTIPAVVFSAFTLALSYCNQLVAVQDFLFVPCKENASKSGSRESIMHLVDDSNDSRESSCSTCRDLRKLPFVEREETKRGMNKIDFACRAYEDSGNKNLTLIKTSLDNAVH